MNVVMLHSVGNHDSSWCQNWLSISLTHFDNFFRYLKENSYETIFLHEWYELQNKTQVTAKNKIVLTFDDGYLDNWVYAYPFLKKYGLKGTIFVNPEFVDPSRNLRPNMEDVWEGKVEQNDLKSLGFLNWEEIKKIDNSSYMDVQSHSMSHNYYFKSDNLLNFYRGQDKYHWLAWNKKPERKPFWITEDQSNLITEGYPIFEYGRALGLRRFLPSKDFEEEFIKKYKELKNSKTQEIEESLKTFTNCYKEKYGRVGEYESDEEMKKRYRYELFESKRTLEEKLNKQIDFLCWPGGGYNKTSLRLSKKAGYKASTLSSGEKVEDVDNSGYYKRIKRFGLGSFLHIENKRVYIRNKNHLKHTFLIKKGSQYHRNLLRIRKLMLKILRLLKLL